ncbi:YbaB/EbfC family nucleoid-associated protein [Rhodococcus sp. HNM0569]|uniref:YbaB/EbfC family nucleoid-associated protein n=1 Tax=Rhodococcus sp. HNM0569 TaxID=2716340 RepID=UPI001F0F8C95|nr:YbaB/EbfC family nucleoid-associated protein [Rhodococcus sp. HNM0569]
MLAAFEDQTRQLAGLRESLGAIEAEGWSTDRHVRVTANAGGIPIDVWIADDAFHRSTPRGLAASVAEAAQAAARNAQQQAAAAVAPITDAAGAMPDLSELTPGAPSLHEIFDSFIPPLDERVPGQGAPTEPNDVARDDDGRPASWLKDRW